MNHKTLLIAFVLVFILTGLSAGIGNQEPFSGDLTRIGAMPDSIFAPRSTDAVIDPAHRINTPIKEAEIIVIGDSFSDHLHWQSVLVKKGIKVHTVHWSALNHGKKDPLAYLKENGARSDAMVIFQTIEREINHKLESLEQAISQRDGAESHVPLGKREESAQPKPDSVRALSVNRMSTGLRISYNRLRLKQNSEFVSGYPRQSEATRVTPIKNGCRFFSNAACDRLLTLAADLVLPHYDPDMDKRLKNLEQRLSVPRSLWLIVPNKSSIYRDDIFNGESGKFHAKSAKVDLFSEFRLLRGQVQDLYQPNDTHLSMRGYVLLGELITNVIGQ